MRYKFLHVIPTIITCMQKLGRMFEFRLHFGHTDSIQVWSLECLEDAFLFCRWSYIRLHRTNIESIATAAYDGAWRVGSGFFSNLGGEQRYKRLGPWLELEPVDRRKQ